MDFDPHRLRTVQLRASRSAVACRPGSDRSQQPSRGQHDPMEEEARVLRGDVR